MVRDASVRVAYSRLPSVSTACFNCSAETDCGAVGSCPPAAGSPQRTQRTQSTFAKEPKPRRCGDSAAGMVLLHDSRFVVQFQRELEIGRFVPREFDRI